MKISEDLQSLCIRIVRPMLSDDDPLAGVYMVYDMFGPAKPEAVVRGEEQDKEKNDLYKAGELRCS